MMKNYEAYQYRETITTILRKLKESFPDISFSVDIECWARSNNKDVESVQYMIYDTKTSKFAKSSYSLEDAYNIKLEQLKNADI